MRKILKIFFWLTHINASVCQSIGLILFSFFCNHWMTAQSWDLPPKRLNITDFGFNYGIPTGVYRNNVQRNVYGFYAGTYFQRRPNDPYAMGLHIFYNGMGCHQVSFLNQSFGGLELFENVSSHNLGTMLAFRFYPDWNPMKFKMYMHFLLGAKILFATRTLYDINREFFDEFEFLQGAVSFSYGGGIGVNYSLSSWLYLNLRCDFIPGISAGYYRKLKEFPSTDFAIDAFDEKNSATDIMNISLGISFFF